MLPLIVIVAIIAVVAVVIGSVVTWLMGLLTAALFAVITLLFLYAFHKMEVLDVTENRWLLFTPFIMFFVGLGLDKGGLLQVQPLSLSALQTNPMGTVLQLSVTNVLLAVIMLLLVVDVLVAYLNA